MHMFPDQPTWIVIDGVAAAPDASAEEVRSLRARVRDLEAERAEADHRIANSLQIAASVLRTQREWLPEGPARDALVAAEMRLRGIVRLHHRIHGEDGAGRICMRGFLDGLAAELTAALGLDCVVGCDEFSVPRPVGAQVAIIVGELALNAVKHAYEGREGGRVVIECRRSGDRFRLKVSDHGPGLLEGFEMGRSQGLGMSVIDAAVRRLGGTMSAHTNGGAHFTLLAPLS